MGIVDALDGKASTKRVSVSLDRQLLHGREEIAPSCCMCHSVSMVRIESCQAPKGRLLLRHTRCTRHQRAKADYVSKS